MDTNALFHMEYGLYLLLAKGEQDNACIINTVMQVTANPLQICIAVNKSNYTHDIIAETKQFNVSVLTQSTPFSVFSAFGFISGRKKNKFENRTDIARAANGIYYLTEHSNACFTAEVIESSTSAGSSQNENKLLSSSCGMIDLSTHTLFIARLTDAVSLSEEPSVTYNYYQKHIKPKPETKLSQNDSPKGYICEVCGYVYEGENLPDDYICPICKHGAEAFRPLS